MKTLVTAIQKGGQGKTFATCHMALDFQERVLRVAVIDLDTQGNASWTLGGHDSDYPASRLFSAGGDELRSWFTDREDDGLFNVGAAFSAGFGSEHGRGYVVEVRMSTLSDIPEKVRNTFENEVADLLEKELPAVFPDRHLKVVRDGPVFKIIGDLGLTDPPPIP